ncbi:hypothetical protein [Amycolatopsis nigrescens]|uniref:hypothetical protein n=1 Tax=Amycolatopsis nigrescens TaxID=381445 RepID=UPI00039F14EB|nr:hypothetical protein [Amycolatopsis nigrescens]
MTRFSANRSIAALAGALALAGAVAAAPAVAAESPAADAQSTTCVDPRNGVPFLASWLGTQGGDILWLQPGAAVAALGGADLVLTNLADPSAVACLGNGGDTFGNSDLQQVSRGSFGVNGGNGNDTIMGGDGNDYLAGDRGQFGEPDVPGVGGNDTLVGGPGMDTADGGPGIDRCDAEIEINCEL